MFRRIAVLLAVNLGLLLAGALAVELVFGEWLGGDGLAALNVQRNIEIRYRADHLYPGGGAIVYRRDRFGLRGDYGGDPSRIELLTIGGSTTNQIYLAEEKSWQAVLARALAEAGRPLIYANAAIDGQSTIGHLAAFERWFPKIPGLRPTWVLAYVGMNDILVEAGANADVLDRFPSFQHHIRRKSALYRLGRTVSGWLAANQGRMTHQKVDYERARWTDQPSRPDWPAHRAQALAAYKERLAALVAAIRKMGAQPILITQRHGDWRRREGRLEGLAESEGGLNGVDNAILLGLYNAVTIETGRALGATVVDLAGGLEFAPGDFYDHVHNTPQGAERIGRFLFAALKETLR
ncbi:MAG: SGNH/GDSL hydrolase family protein [Rhodospirillales bacterium]|nr:SGNH/GDSL hydrolase family protein [Rhodospirillales bacterium]